jgi:hypothetical protein
VLYGLRGVGKTVLLRRLAKEVEDRNWIVAQVEAGTGVVFRQLLVEALHRPLVDLARPSAGQHIRRALKTAIGFKVTVDQQGAWIFGLDLAAAGGGGANTGDLQTDLGQLVRDLADAAAEQRVGLAILIDEAQDLTPDELIALCATAHAAGQRDHACLFALAGLPSLPRVLAAAKSYSERLFDFDRIEQLDHDLALAAITESAEQEGATWDSDAAKYVVRETAGYPYFIQQFGQETWNLASGHRINLADARVGTSQGLAALDNGFFRSRWDRATRSEQKYLRAMTTDGDEGSSGKDISARMNRAIQSIGPARASLIAKGLEYAPEHGVVAFTVPGMADFIQRQPADSLSW